MSPWVWVVVGLAGYLVCALVTVVVIYPIKVRHYVAEYHPHRCVAPYAYQQIRIDAALLASVWPLCCAGWLFMAAWDGFWGLVHRLDPRLD